MRRVALLALALVACDVRGCSVMGGAGKMGGALSMSTPTPTSPTINSISPTSGCPGDAVVFTGARFTSATSVDFNGASATYSVDSSTQITAVVPNAATTGVVHVVTPSGTATGPTFTANSCAFAFDLTGASVPSGLTTARTGGTVYAQNGAHTVAAYTGTYVLEDMGDGGGSGLWTFGPHINDAPSPTNFAAAGWTNTGLTVTTGVADPSGGTGASKIATTTTGTCGNLAFGPLGASDQVHSISSIWYQNASPAPSPHPGFVGVTSGGPLWSYLTSQANWTRAFVDFNKIPLGLRQSYLYFSPASYPQTGINSGTGPTCDGGATGAINAWGAQATSVADFGIVPLFATSSGAATLAVSAGSLANVLTGSDFHIEASYLMDPYFQGGPTTLDTSSPYLFSMTTTGGQTFIRLGSSTVYSTSFQGGAESGLNLGTLPQGSYGPSQFKMEIWSRSSDSKGGVQFWVNGSRSGATGRLTFGGVAIGAPSAMYFGSNLGSGGYFARRWTTIKKTTTSEDHAEGVVLADSIHAAYSGVHTGIPTWIYIASEALSRDGIVSYAYPGETFALQTTRWDNSAQKGAAGVKWVLIALGVNDIHNSHLTAAQTASAAQSLINDVHTANPTAKILIAQIQAAKGSVGATDWTTCLEYNSDVAGTGPNPITDPGSVLIRLPYRNDMDNGWHATGTADGTLYTVYDSGDGIHENDTGGRQLASDERAALIANGLL